MIICHMMKLHVQGFNKATKEENNEKVGMKFMEHEWFENYSLI